MRFNFVVAAHPKVRFTPQSRLWRESFYETIGVNFYKILEEES